MGDIIEMGEVRRIRRLKRRLKVTRTALVATKRYYLEIQPLFQYKLVYDMGKTITDFRRVLINNIKGISKELRKSNEK